MISKVRILYVSHITKQSAKSYIWSIKSYIKKALYDKLRHKKGTPIEVPEGSTTFPYAKVLKNADNVHAIIGASWECA